MESRLGVWEVQEHFHESDMLLNNNGYAWMFKWFLHRWFIFTSFSKRSISELARQRWRFNMLTVCVEYRKPQENSLRPQCFLSPAFSSLFLFSMFLFASKKSSAARVMWIQWKEERRIGLGIVLCSSILYVYDASEVAREKQMPSSFCWVLRAIVL